MLAKKEFFDPNHDKFVLVDGKYDVDFKRRFKKFLQSHFEIDFWEILIEDDFETLERLCEVYSYENIILIPVKSMLN